MFKKLSKLPIKALVILIIVVVLVIAIGITMIVTACLSDTNRLKYHLLDNDTYEVTDVKDTFRGGIFAKDTITVPAEYRGKKVTSIKTLNLQKTQNVIVSDGIEEIQLSAFYKSSVVSVQLPSSIKTIANNAFTGCMSLKEINLPDGLLSIGSATFKDCLELEQITLPASVKEISNNLFNGCLKLKSFNVPAGITSIGDSAFAGCEQLGQITIADTVTKIGASAFEGCKAVTSLALPSSLTSVGANIVKGCDSLTLNVNGNSKYLGNGTTSHLVLIEASPADVAQGEFRVSNDAIVIADGAFDSIKDDVQKIFIANVKSVGANTFKYTSINKTTSQLDYTDLPVLQQITLDDNNKEFVSINGVLLNKDATEFLCIPLATTELTIPETVTTFDPYLLKLSEYKLLERVIFDVTEGWTVRGNSVPATDLADPAKALTLVTDTYSKYVWKRG